MFVSDLGSQEPLTAILFGQLFVYLTDQLAISCAETRLSFTRNANIDTNSTAINCGNRRQCVNNMLFKHASKQVAGTVRRCYAD